MEMISKSIGSLAIKIKTGFTPKTEDVLNFEDANYNWFTPGDFSQSKVTLYNSARKISDHAVKNSATIFEPKTILITCIGDVGNSGIINKASSANQQITGILVDEKIINPFLFNYLIRHNKRKLKSKSNQALVPILNNRNLKEIELSFPKDLETQNKIVATLDKAKTILDKREETVQKYNELLQATFFEMFGSPILNPKGWKTKSLLRIGEFKNGVNYKRDESGHSVLCLGVGDFQSNWEIQAMNNLPLINLKKIPSDDYFLKDNDLVFVRSNGNKQLVGRCVLVKPGKENVTFSGFCIRFRLNDPKVSSTYLVHLFRVPAFKSAMLQNGRGANIQNINQELLGNLIIPLPPEKLQLEFEKQVFQLQKGLTKAKLFQSESEGLLRSLSQQVFSDHINIDIDTELEALINAIDLDKKGEENNIDTVKKDLTFLQRLIDKLRDQDFENFEQYEKAKYMGFKIMKEESNLIKQRFTLTKNIVLEI